MDNVNQRIYFFGRPRDQQSKSTSHTNDAVVWVGHQATHAQTHPHIYTLQNVCAWSIIMTAHYLYSSVTVIYYYKFIIIIMILCMYM